MPEPGVPVSPTHGMRTKPEASEFAMKNKATSDWFRHDGKNAESPPAAASRLSTKQAQDIAQKYKSENEWFDHQANGAAGGNKQSDSAHGRCRTAEARKNADKIGGKEEEWYRHDRNSNYSAPRPKSRTQNEGTNIKEKLVAESGEWYRHDVKNANGYIPQKAKQRIPTAQSQENFNRMMPTGTPSWADYERKPDEVESMRPASRLTAPESGEYLDRNRYVETLPESGEYIHR